MPFTLSHAAAVLPGIRRDGTSRGPLLASALVAGSVAPDMTYFAATAVPGAMEFGAVTHGPAGLFTVDVLIAAALVGLWLLLREPLVALLPSRWRGRVYACVRGPDRRGGRRPALAARFYVSAVLGASTHVVWDAFTHVDRWGTRALPTLGEIVGGFPLYTYTQYGSSALALVALGWFTVSAVRRLPAGPAPAAVPVLGRRERALALALLAVCVLLGMAHRFARWYAYHGQVSTPLDVIPTLCFGAGAGLAAGLVLYGAGARLRAARTRPAGPAAAPASPDRARTGPR
ncbi:DUF4184 family protein [Streptomyces sp. NBC_01498]|uniref:DUF4184 family protein n=1 Tax=Streptomyces sp. NBC_01498 TaxID=2975870 RepID=UPI002E7AF4AA|nr:DUF4184 family protein [Streptomyces sp. NBC_01498]WTL27410.1 DUF4184 family protein [Streptomyces sp. NBC_01498]